MYCKVMIIDSNQKVLFNWFKFLWTNLFTSLLFF